MDASSERRRGRLIAQRAFVLIVTIYVLFALTMLWRKRRVRIERWPTLEHIELELDLSAPPVFQATARIDLSGVTEERIPLLLNRALRVTSAELAGDGPIEWSAPRRFDSPYHTEGGVTFFDLDVVPSDGHASLRIAYSGTGMNGSEGRDWRGILLLAPDELRMSEQTVFHPQIPHSADGPGVQASTARVQVLAPPDFEVFAPGEPCEPTIAKEGARSWCFELERPGTLAVLAGRRVRREVESGGARIVTLLLEEHADLGELFARSALRALEYFGARYGPLQASSLGIVEIEGRGSSYNWAQQGVVTFDRYALGRGVPEESLAHEIAHLWWGQSVASRGPGERFLTESLAEWSSWRLIHHVEGAEAAEDLARTARAGWVRGVHEAGSDAALASVEFATPGYQALAYQKGPLVLRYVESQLGAERFDAALAEYAARGASGGGTLALFSECLARAAGGPVEIPWLERAGHAHLVLEDLEFDASAKRVRARVESRDCPEGIARVLPPSIVLDVRSRNRSERIEVALAEDPAPIEFAFPDDPEWIGLDPDGRAPVADAPPLVRGGARLLGSEPADGAQDVPLGKLELRLRFDRGLSPLLDESRVAIQRASLDAALGGSVVVATIRDATLAEDGRVLVLAVDGTLPSRRHVVVVPATLTDVHGIPLPETRVEFRIASAEGLERPRIVETVPSTGAEEVPTDVAVIRVVFSRPMRSGQGFKKGDVRAQKTRGREWPPIGFAEWTDARTAVFPIEGELLPGTTYALPFRALFLDELGVGLEDHDLVFTTAAEAD